MKQIKKYLTIPVLLSAVCVTMLAAQAFGQKYAETKAACKQSANPETKAQLLKCLPEKKDEKLQQTPFVKRVIVNLNGSDVNVVAMQIPAGKRLVIESVSAIVRSGESQRVAVDYFTYTNNGGAADKTIHNLALEKQASFKDSAIFTTNQKQVVFADEQIGSEHFSVGISARLSGVSTQPAQAQFTFSGYLEDLPAN